MEYIDELLLKTTKNPISSNASYIMLTCGHKQKVLDSLATQHFSLKYHNDETSRCRTNEFLL